MLVKMTVLNIDFLENSVALKTYRSGCLLYMLKCKMTRYSKYTFFAVMKTPNFYWLFIFRRKCMNTKIENKYVWSIMHSD